MTVGVLAVFSDQEQVGANAFSTGTVDISTAPTSAAVSFSNMLPGDQVTDDLVVTNERGSVAVRYSLTFAATNADSKGLKDQLVMTVKTIDATTPGTPCNDFDGTSSTPVTWTRPEARSSATRRRARRPVTANLAVSASETLCFRVALPLLTGNAYKNAATTATFTFHAEQTANNP